MAEDVFKPSGQLKASKPDAGGKAPVRNVPVIGVVKDNIDPNKSGRIFVYIDDNSGSDPDDRGNWVPVSYLSPFYGKTIPTSNNEGWGTYTSNPISYGFWNSPPDIGTSVICLFINGDMNYGFYIGAIPEPEALQMVPAIGATDNIVANEGEANSYGGALRLPVTNINPNNPGIADSPEFLSDAKPVHSYASAILFQQGLIRDPIRGPIGSSAQRESPSRVGWGVSTPGRPIYEGGFTDESIASAALENTQEGMRVIGRRNGHSIVMDDGDMIGRDQLVRLRSALGHQILMSDDGQTLFIIHANGQTYVELGKEGTVDIYSTNSFNVRTQGDLNLHADNDVNIHATKRLNIYAENLNVEVDKTYSTRVNQTYKLSTGEKYLIKSGTQMALTSASSATINASGGPLWCNGRPIYLNTGKSGVQGVEVDALTKFLQTDTMFDQEKGFAAAPAKLKTITTRTPAHSPWANANQGVNVKSNLNADSNLPEPASSPVEKLTDLSQDTPVVQTTVGQVATIPNSQAISPALDQNTSTTMIGQIAKDAASGAAPQIVQQGAQITTVGGQKVMTVGSYAQTTGQMQLSGIIKPGSAPLINSLVNSGLSPTAAMPNSLFTNRQGVNSLGGFTNSVSTQTNSVLSGLQQVQRSLQQMGIITGREPAVQTAGMVMAGTKAGLAQTVQAVKTVNTIGNILNNTTNSGTTGAVMGAIAAGTFAANLATKKTSGLQAISQAVNAASRATTLGGLNQLSRGLAGAAFDAVLKSFPKLKPGVPQKLGAIAKSNFVSQVALTSVSSILNTPKGAGSITDAAAQVAIGTLRGASGQIASGVGGLPGGARVLASVVNASIPSLVSQVPGLERVNVLTTGAQSSVMNRLPIPNIPGLSGITQGASKVVAGLGGLSKTLGSVTGLGGSAFNLGGSNLGASGQFGSLSSFASAGLAGPALASLTGALSAFGLGGKSKIVLPTIASNTYNRGQLDASLVNVLGDNRIPRPNYTGRISEQSKSAYEAQSNLLAEKVAASKELSVWLDRIRTARIKYENLKNTLPAGDPAIDDAKLEWFQLTEDPEYLRLRKIVG